MSNRLITESVHQCGCVLRNQVHSNEKNRQTYHNKKNAMMIPPNLLSELLARLRSLVKRGGQKLQ